MRNTYPFPSLPSMVRQILAQQASGKLKDAAYPFVDQLSRKRPQEVFVFIVGGCTHEEAAAVCTFYQANECASLILFFVVIDVLFYFSWIPRPFFS